MTSFIFEDPDELLTNLEAEFLNYVAPILSLIMLLEPDGAAPAAASMAE